MNLIKWKIIFPTIERISEDKHRKHVSVSVSVCVPQSAAGPPGEGLDEELRSGERSSSASAALSRIQPGAEEGSWNSCRLF